ncbi:MAG: flagellar motor switch protein FliG [Desulfobacteraceae bacterium]|nr:MAG: flagellar motor switch protein FliG [Desulfobacteraceae bacterium]
MNANMNDTKKITGLQKSAILLMAMGEEFTASFFKKIDENTIKKIGRYMTKISFVPPDVLNSVMDEFAKNYENDRSINMSGKSFLKQVVDKSSGESSVREAFKSIERENENAPFSELAYLSAKSAIGVFKNEHPQTIALVLSNLPQEKAAEILSLFPDEIKTDIAFRILQIGEVQNDIIMDLDEIIKNEINSMGTASTKKINGVDALAGILNEMDGKTEKSIMAHIEKEDGDMAERIRQKMFLFEDLIKVDDKGFREILKNINNDVIIKALKTASEDMKQKIFTNLSERAAEMLKEDLEVLGPVRLKEVEENQQLIIKAAKKLESDGRLVLSGKGREDIFV